MKNRLLMIFLLLAFFAKLNPKIIFDVKSNKELEGLVLRIILRSGNGFCLLVIRPDFNIALDDDQIGHYLMNQAYWAIKKDRLNEQFFYQDFNDSNLRGALFKSDVLDIPLRNKEFRFRFDGAESYCDVGDDIVDEPKFA